MSQGQQLVKGTEQPWALNWPEHGLTPGMYTDCPEIPSSFSHTQALEHWTLDTGSKTGFFLSKPHKGFIRTIHGCWTRLDIRCAVNTPVTVLGKNPV